MFFTLLPLWEVTVVRSVVDIKVSRKEVDKLPFTPSCPPPSLPETRKRHFHQTCLEAQRNVSEVYSVVWKNEPARTTYKSPKRLTRGLMRSSTQSMRRFPLGKLKICTSRVLTDAIRKSNDSATSILTLCTMPTDAHDCIQRWVIEQVGEWRENGQLSREEKRLVELGSGTSKLSYNSSM